MSTARSKLLPYVCGAAFALLLSALLFLLEIPPEGRFRVDSVATEGPAYFEFKNGKAALITYPDKHATGSRIRTNNLGSYTSRNGEWLLFSPTGQTNELRATLLYIQISPTDEYPERYRRILGRP